MSTRTSPMGFSQEFIAANFGTAFSDEIKARIGDNRRERNARSEGR